MKFCKPTDKKKDSEKISILDDYTCKIFNSIKQVPQPDWENSNINNNFFLSPEYLEVLENTKLSEYKFIYSLICLRDKPVGIIYFQLVDFRPDIFGNIISGQVKKFSNGNNDAENFKNKSENSSGLFQLLTLGNNFITGEHGFQFISDVSRSTQFELLEALSKLICQKEKLKGKISALLIKDFYPKQLPEKNKFTESKFIEFFVEPNMILNLPDNLNSLNDYISLFSKKYRNRAKKIFNCASGIDKIDLSLDKICELRNEIYNLYLQVYDNAKFKLVKLGPDYFSDCKNKFGERFIVTGYFLNGKIIAFNSSIILNETDIEAHFIGIDYSLNIQFELYQNILYNFIELTISKNRKVLNFGRTAAEIKSTIGAKSEDMLCYVKPQNSFSKLILKSFLSFLRPSDWTPRNPFKEN
ncbi:MAG: hypothetical protein ACK5AY_01500 [Bacteroidota bacterium]|jgi:hypothetical protein